MGFARVGHDSESYWMLTYRPERADGRFHPLEARTKVRDAWIRTRTGYWASPAGTWSIPAPSIPDSARFAVPPGRVELDMVVLGAAGDVLDTDARSAPVRTVNPIDDMAWPGVTQFTLPLASLAAGEYLIELAGTNVNGRVTTRVAIRVTG
jgi:hypothetical protein